MVKSIYEYSLKSKWNNVPLVPGRRASRKQVPNFIKNMNSGSYLRRNTSKYNFRKVPYINYNNQNSTVSNIHTDPDINQNLWSSFNEYRSIIENENNRIEKNEWVSATKVKNYLLNDPIIDWLDLYHNKPEYNPNMNNKSNFSFNPKKEDDKFSVLFTMGNKFEDEVCKFLNQKYQGNIVNIVNNPRTDINQKNFQLTFQKMKEGVPIITQAMLYNHQNRTFGVADLLVRSDWLNHIFSNAIVDNIEENYKAPYLDGNYHYRVIDIKWTTIELCSNGKLIRNNQRFPAYKGQLAIYNAALGQLQGYTPNKAYIMAKSWKFNSEGAYYNGYNCFDLLGEIDYENFDQNYLKKTSDAVHWVRNVRYNGRSWSCVPPSVPELYPNMCNRFDNPFHKVKRDIATQINELTEIWMVGTKNRNIAHENGIYKWTDEDCNSQNMGINGKKIGPIVDKIININRDPNGPLVQPDIILNNENDWQTKKDIEFFIDFEGLNSCFYNRDIEVEDSKQNEGIIFLIGVGYEELGEWKYKPFFMRSINRDEEQRAVDEFATFIESKVEEHMIKYNIENRNLCFPTFYHWGHAERTMFKNVDKKFENRWKLWQNSIVWIDFCKVFQSEPIVVKNAKKFNLKEIARAFKSHGLINTVWSDSGIDCGLSAMIDATDFYRELDIKGGELTTDMEKIFTEIVDYNEIDCKTVWEIVEYLRNNNIKK